MLRVVRIGGLISSLAASVVITFAAANVAAQDADALRAQGRTALREGRFEDALRLFRQAALDADPSVWLEVGDAADRLRNDAVALDAYERYLAARPNAPERAEVAARVRILRAVLARAAPRRPNTTSPDFIPASTILDAYRGPLSAGLGRRLGRP